jgi:two-component system, chemotaxis family, protein-glutamate methylesterase/glutaminase
MSIEALSKTEIMAEQGSDPKFIVVIGASAGGFHSLVELMAELDGQLDIAVLAVLHVTKMSKPSAVLERLQPVTSFRCKFAEDNETIARGHFYLAPPDVHLLVKDGKTLLGRGPTENRWRPSIDMLFRSAAANYNSRSIGIILSGLLQDGTSGMDAIQRSGGTLIVQDPNEAEYPDMPSSVLQNLKADYVVSLAQMGAILKEKTSNGMPPRHEVPHVIAMEARIAEKVATAIENLWEIGEKSDFTCPKCGGGLYELKEGPLVHLKCHVGHSFTEGELLFELDHSLESTLWVALRMMEERRLLLKKLITEETDRGWLRSASLKQEREEEMQRHIDRLKEVLFAAQSEARST